MRISDNTSEKYNELSEVKTIVDSIKDKTIQKLSNEGLLIFPNVVSDSNDILEKQMILQSIDAEIKVGNLMGFIGNKDERLIIGSRFDSGEKDYFLQYVLSKVCGNPNVLNMPVNMDESEKILNYMLFIFPLYLKNSLRKGILKHYRTFQYNDLNVKGVIDFNRHIKLNMPFMGNIAYNRREYIYDKNVFQLIRHTIEYIKKEKKLSGILNDLHKYIEIVYELTYDYNFYDRNKIINMNKVNIVKHPYYIEYRNLQILCILILQNKKHQIDLGRRKIYGILFDGSWLWEEYIYNLIKEFFIHPQNRKKEYKQHFFTDNTGEIYPDYISNDKNIVIGDAKYKPKENINGKDYQQILSYMFRFESKKGFFVYPNNVENLNDEKKYLYSGVEGNVNKLEKNRNEYIVKYGLDIPNNVKDYDEFKTQMINSENKFIDYVKDLLD